MILQLKRHHSCHQGPVRSLVNNCSMAGCPTVDLMSTHGLQKQLIVSEKYTSALIHTIPIGCSEYIEMAWRKVLNEIGVQEEVTGCQTNHCIKDE